MTDETTIGATPTVRPKKRGRKVVASTLALAIVGTAGAVGASQAFRVKADRSGAQLTCPGGIESLGHVHDESASIFPGDPETEIERLDFYYEDGGEEFFSYRIEALHTATHTGTHLDAPSHFIEAGARSVDDLDASEFVWPSYIIDVRDWEADSYDFQITVDQIKAYEKKNGKIQRGSLVIVQTGLAEFFGTGDPDAYTGYFADAPGFSGEAVQWMIDERGVKAIGSDSFGPDATSDELFDATYTILANDGVAIPGLTNLDSMSVKGDIVMAAPVKLLDGSAFQVNPLACLGSSSGHHSNGNGNGHGKDRDRD
ncbi:MAG: cyclase family protein [Acidimicrobiales bacterium]